MKIKLKVIATAIAAALLLTGCDSPNEERSNISTIKTPPIISRSTSTAKTEPAEKDNSSVESSVSEPAEKDNSSVESSVSEPVEKDNSSVESSVSEPVEKDNSSGESSAVSETAKKDDSVESSSMSEPVETDVSTSSIVPNENVSGAQNEPSWVEWDYNAEFYISSDVYGKLKPLEDSQTTRMYKLDEPVTAVAFTSTRYFKLSNGDYIFAEYLSPEKVYSFETVKTELSYEPPARTKGRTAYDPKKALDYAKEHWQEEESLCAGFGSECLTAGGLDYNETSSTKLFNRLVESKLGYTVMIDLNEDGTANVPEFVYPGDIIFYYCEDENMMVHTAVYNGDTKDGIMKAYAHNYADNGESEFRYEKYCVGGCGCLLDKIAVFCFYRDDSNVTLPTGTPKLTSKTVHRKVNISWSPDFVYRSSELVITDNKGKIVRRVQMGTDKNAVVDLKEENYLAYVIFTVYGNTKVRSDNLILSKTVN